MNPHNSQIAQIYLEQGLAYWSEQKWRDAINACEKALSFDSNLVEAHKIAGNSWQKIGNIADAIGSYAKALEIEPDFAEIYANLGTLYAQQQQWQQALKYYQQAAELKPDFPGVYVQLAKVWKKLGHSQSAEKMLLQARQLESIDRLSGRECFTLALQFQQQGKLAEALKFYEQGISLIPDSLPVYRELATICEQLQLWEKAANYYRQILELQPSDRSIAPSQLQLRLSEHTVSNNKQYILNPARSNSYFPEEKIQHLQQKPESGEQQLHLGNLYARQQQWQQAITHYKKAIALKPDCALAYRNLARVLSQLGESDAATSYWLKAVELEAKGVKAQEYSRLSDDLVERGQFDKAITCYRRAIGLQPDLVESFIGLGKLLSRLQQTTEALSCYRQGIEHHPQSYQLQYALAEVLATEGEWSSAVTAYQKALELNPQSVDARYGLAVAYSKDRQWQQAITHYQAAIEFSKDTELANNLYYYLGEAFYENRQPNEAQSALETAVRQNPNLARAYYYLGLVSLQQQQVTQARDYFERCIALEPESHESYYRLGEIALERENFDAAYNYLQRASELNPQHGWTYFRLGAIFQKWQQWERSSEAYSKFTDLEADFWEGYYRLGESLIQQGKKEEAVSAFRRCLALNPDNPWTYYNLGTVLAQLEQQSEAIELLQKSLELNPGFSWSYYHLGECYVHENRWTEAVSAYQGFIEIESDFAYVYQRLGLALEKMARSLDEEQASLKTAQAVECYSRAIALQPEDLPPYYRILELQPDNYRICAQLADRYRLQEKWANAIVFYRIALDIEPNQPQICFELGKILEQQYQTEAITYYRRACDLDSQNSLYNYHLRKVLTKSDRHFNTVISHV